MDFFIKKIFNGKTEKDSLVHSQFQKFSKGEFGSKAMVVAKQQAGGRYSISTTAEYAKGLVMNLAEKLGDEKTLVTGALISTLDLEGFEYKEKKSAIGIKKYLIESEMSGNEILELCNKLEKAFFGLSFKVGDAELKIKPKSPKSAKGAGSKKKEGEKLKADFCKLKTDDKEIVDNLIFDSEAENFKSIEITHDFIIEDIVVSEELKKEAGNDFARIREEATRKGKIIRKLNIDGKDVVKESEFEA